jgi:hypothetical protein
MIEKDWGTCDGTGSHSALILNASVMSFDHVLLGLSGDESICMEICASGGDIGNKSRALRCILKVE